MSAAASDDGMGNDESALDHARIVAMAFDRGDVRNTPFVVRFSSNRRARAARFVRSEPGGRLCSFRGDSSSFSGICEDQHRAGMWRAYGVRWIVKRESD